MFIESITIEDQERGPDAVVVNNPHWHKIESAIVRMEGNLRSVLTLNAAGNDSSFMGIGGGEKGVYVCFVIDEKGAETKLVDPAKDANGTFAIHMGQTNIRASNESTDLRTILAVAMAYAESGELHPDFEWRHS